MFGRGDNEDFQLKGYDVAAHAIAEMKDEPQPYKLREESERFVTPARH